MVSKAIERAQNTVEGRNAEIRKDVLKYDEVMNEQRKVIYARRQQILDGEDLHEQTFEMIEAKLADIVVTHCPSEFAEEWEIDSLINEAATYYPLRVSAADLRSAHGTAGVHALLMEDAFAVYRAKCDALPNGVDDARLIERDVMLQILDQRWRDHLSDMDHLRDGIGLRAIAQQDPLVAWQREGYSMFEHLLEAVDDDYVRYITHIETVAAQPERTNNDRAVTNANGGEIPGSLQPNPAGPAVKPASPNEKIGRNDPCYCGSGKKFKQCHGRP